MALIQCPECQKEISDKARSCPNCGCPVTFQTFPISERIKLWGYVFICLGTLFVTFDVFKILNIKGGLVLIGVGWLMFGISLISQGKDREYPEKPAAYTIVVISTVIIILSIVGLIFDQLA